VNTLRKADYDVVVVHYDNPEVYGVLEAALAQTNPPQRIALVDNSGDVDEERVRRIAPDALLISSSNEGYAAAANAGIRAVGSSGAPYVVVLTHEVRLEEVTLDRLVGALEDDSSLAAVGPVLRFRSLPDRVFSRGGRLDRFARPSPLTSPSPQATSDPMPMSWIDGSVMALRRTAVEHIGLFDTRYFLYFEEIDLSVRLRRAGWGTAVVPTAVAWQEPGGYPPYLALRNRVLMIRQNPGLLTFPAWLLYPRLVAEIAWTARRRGLRSIAPSFRGLVAGTRGLIGPPPS
jgi:GT2 family glycosyltransferase